MKQRPIIFNTEMVKAILDNRKTQTRRVIKPQPDYSILKNGVTLEPHKCPVLGPVNLGHREWGLYGSPYKPTDVSCFAYNCPYGKVGDRLWVRESWGVEQRRYIKPSDNTPVGGIFEDEVFYRADDKNLPGMKWKPSIHMFRKDSRIDLEITDIRVERVQDISEEDAIAEGIEREFVHGKDIGWKNYLWHGHFGQCGMGNKQSDSWDYQYSTYDNPKRCFSSLWESINAKGGYSWESNPYVWMVSFKKVA